MEGGGHVAEAGAFDAKWYFRKLHQGQGRRIGHFDRAVTGECDGRVREGGPGQSVRCQKVRLKC
jgi:hypothetical protein